MKTQCQPHLIYIMKMTHIMVCNFSQITACHTIVLTFYMLFMYQHTHDSHMFWHIISLPAEIWIVLFTTGNLVIFLAATKQLNFLSVCLSVCHTFFTMFPSSYRHEIFRIYYLIPHQVASEHRWLVKAPWWIHSVPDVSGRRSWRCQARL